LVRSDFLSADVLGADYVYLYLFPQHILDIEDRLFAHMKNDAIIISNTFSFGKHVPFQTIKDNK